MVDTVFAVDNNDEILGDFYSLCHYDLMEYFNENNITPVYLKSGLLNDLSVSLAIKKLIKFVFIAYSHGSEDSLFVNGINPYINTTINIAGFKNALFYTCSCDTGKQLGLNLVENGCLCFIGYKSKFTVWDYNKGPFIECANYGIKLFFSDISTDEIIEKMKEKYNTHIDNYNNDIFGAAMLLSNRNSLIRHGQIINLSQFVN